MYQMNIRSRKDTSMKERRSQPAKSSNSARACRRGTYCQWQKQKQQHQ